MSAISIFLRLFVHVLFFVLWSQGANSQFTSGRIERAIVSQTEDFVTERIRLDTLAFGRAEFFKRTPRGPEAQAWPTLVLLSGLHIGKNSLDLVPPIKGLSVVTMDYPFDMARPTEKIIEALPKDYLRIQAQVMALFLWLKSIPEVDADKIVSLNISFGSFVVPQALVSLQKFGFVPAATVFAFGGSDFISVLEYHLAKKNLDPQVQDLARVQLSRLKKQIRPEQHLPRLKGPFLVVLGTEDEVVPPSVSRSTFNALQEPKTLLELPVGHINSDQPEIIQSSLSGILRWLQENQILKVAL